MINQETVFVLGAGASKPYGYPTGKELLKEFVDLENENDFLDLVKNAFPHLFMGNRDAAKKYFSPLVKEIKNSRVKSIDAYYSDIANQGGPSAPDNEAVGKFSLSYVVDRCDRKNPDIEVSETEDWYGYLYNDFLRRGCKNFDDFLKNKISFVTFNYDLSLERYFESALRISYGVRDFNGFVNKIPILHVHGKNRFVSQQTIYQQKISSQFGISSHDPPVVMRAKEIYENSQGIQFAHRELDQNSSLPKVKELLAKAKRVFFLGFGYLESNMEKLAINWVNHYDPANISGYTKYYGTCLGFEGSEAQRLIRILKAVDGGGNEMLALQNINCLNFLRFYANEL